MAIISESMHEMAARTAKTTEEIAREHLLMETNHDFPIVRIFQVNNLRPGNNDTFHYLFREEDGWEYLEAHLVLKCYPSPSNELLHWADVEIQPLLDSERHWDSFRIALEDGCVRLRVNHAYTPSFQAKLQYANEIIKVNKVRVVTLHQGDELTWESARTGTKFIISALNVPRRSIQPNFILNPAIPYITQHNGTNRNELETNLHSIVPEHLYEE